MSTRKFIFASFSGIATALGIAWLIRRFSQKRDNFTIWQEALAEQHGAAGSQELIGQARQRYQQLLVEKPLPDNPVLRGHVTKSILPGLALYQVLLQEYENDSQAALAEIERAFRATTLARNRLVVMPLKILPSWELFRIAFNKMMKSFPAEGWNWEYVENSEKRVAFNGSRCFYLDTLKAYGAPELTASFCKGDEVMAELFPPMVRFVREHTLGRGDAVCDFQYYREE